MEPGGGVLKGCTAQEECQIRCSLNAYIQFASVAERRATNKHKYERFANGRYLCRHQDGRNELRANQPSGMHSWRVNCGKVFNKRLDAINRNVGQGDVLYPLDGKVKFDDEPKDGSKNQTNGIL